MKVIINTRGQKRVWKKGINHLCEICAHRKMKSVTGKNLFYLCAFQFRAKGKLFTSHGQGRWVRGKHECKGFNERLK